MSDDEKLHLVCDWKMLKAASEKFAGKSLRKETCQEMVFDADIDTFLEKLKSKLLKEFDIENGEILRIEKGSVWVFIRLERTQSERILDAKDQWGDFLLKDVRVLKTSSATTR